MKIARNIFVALTLLLFVPILWHAIAPLSLCWLQPEQIAMSIFCAIAFGLTAFGLHMEMES